MDPITLAITTALANLSQDVVRGAYAALKGKLRDKFGGNRELVEAVDKLEQKPESKARQAMLQEEVASSGAAENPDLLQLAEALLTIIKEQPGGQTNVNQVVRGDRNIFSGTGNVTITDRPKD